MLTDITNQPGRLAYHSVNNYAQTSVASSKVNDNTERSNSNRVYPTVLQTLPYNSSDKSGGIPGQTMAKIALDYANELRAQFDQIKSNLNSSNINPKALSGLESIYEKINDNAILLIEKYGNPESASSNGVAVDQNASMDTNDMAFLAIVFRTMGQGLQSIAPNPEIRELADTAKELNIMLTAKAAPALQREIQDKIFKDNEYIMNPGAEKSISGDIGIGAALDLMNIPKVKISGNNPISNVLNSHPVTKFVEKLGNLFPGVNLSSNLKGNYTHVLRSTPDGEVGYTDSVSLGGNFKLKFDLWKILNVSGEVNTKFTHSTKLDDSLKYYGSLLHLAEQEALKKDGNYLAGTKVKQVMSNKAYKSDLNSEFIAGNTSRNKSDLNSWRELRGALNRKRSALDRVKRTLRSDFHRENTISRRHNEKPKSLNAILQRAINHQESLLNHLRKLGHQPDDQGIDVFPPSRNLGYYVEKFQDESVSFKGSIALDLGTIEASVTPVSGTRSHFSFPFVAPDTLWSQMGAMDDEIDDIHKNQKAMHQQRKQEFSKMEKNVLPRINTLLQAKIPEPEQLRQPIIDNVDNNVLFAVLSDIEKEFDQYVAAVKISDRSEKSSTARSEKHAIEDRWGGQVIRHNRGKRPGREGYLQAMLIAHSAIGQRIKNNHSMNKQGIIVNPDLASQWQQSKEKLDALGQKISNPGIFLDENKLKKNTTFGIRSTPDAVTYSVNFAVDVGLEREKEITNIGDFSNLSVDVSISKSSFDIPIMSRTGDSIVVNMTIPIAMAINFADLPTLNEKLTKQLNQHGINESVSDALSAALTPNISANSGEKVQISWEMFKPKKGNYSDSPGELQSKLKYRRVLLTHNESAGTEANILTPVPVLAVPFTSAINRSVTRVVHEKIGTDTLAYLLQLDARLKVAAGKEMNPNPRLGEILDKHKKSILLMLKNAANPQTNIHHEIFVREFSDSLKEGMSKLTNKLQMNHIISNDDSEFSQLSERINKLLTIRRNIIKAQSDVNHREVLNTLMPRGDTDNEIQTAQQGENGYMSTVKNIDTELARLGTEFKDWALNHTSRAPYLPEAKKEKINNLAQTIENITGVNISVRDAVNKLASGDNSVDHKEVFAEIASMHDVTAGEYKSRFKESIGFEGKILSGKVSTDVNHQINITANSHHETQVQQSLLNRTSEEYVERDMEARGNYLDIDFDMARFGPLGSPSVNSRISFERVNDNDGLSTADSIASRATAPAGLNVPNAPMPAESDSDSVNSAASAPAAINVSNPPKPAESDSDSGSVISAKTT